MTSAVRAVPKSGFLGARLGCGDIHALNRCFILAISLSLYSRAILDCARPLALWPESRMPQRDADASENVKSQLTFGQSHRVRHEELIFKGDPHFGQERAKCR